MADSNGILHSTSLSHADALGHLVLAVLLTMSLACWYQIALKSWQVFQLRRQGRRSAAGLTACASPAAFERLLTARPPGCPWVRLSHLAMDACRQWNGRRDGQAAIQLSAPDVFLLQAFNRGLAEAGARLDAGLAVIGSVAATAPFVGLFGTVWGIYHALIGIGVEGAGSLDKVAGPVGEALVMTACGLAVAIPALLAYNALGRANRRLLDELEGFAHELLGFLVSGLAPTVADPRPADSTAPAHAVPVARAA